MRAKRSASTSSVRALISSALHSRPRASVIGNVSVASETKSTAKPRSEAWRVVVSQHCSVRMPETIARRTPCEISQTSSPLPTSALCLRFLKIASGAICQRRERGHQARRLGEDAGLFDMEHLHDRNAEPLGAVDQRLLALDIGVETIGAEIGPMAEQFLGVDDDQRGVGGGHFRTLRLEAPAVLYRQMNSRRNALAGLS